MLKLRIRKYSQFYAQKFCLSQRMDSSSFVTMEAKVQVGIFMLLNCNNFLFISLNILRVPERAVSLSHSFEYPQHNMFLVEKYAGVTLSQT